MKQLTKEQLEEKGFQEKLQFGTRVETTCGKKGIVNFNSVGIDSCRVYYDEGKETKCVIVKMSECRILSLDEAVGI